jgi:hypothetical protein
MVVITEEIILKLVDLSTILIGAFVAALFAYFFGIKNLIKSQALTREENRISRQENELFRKIELYKKLIEDINYIVKLKNPSEKEKTIVIDKMNSHGLALLQFAPDYVYKEFTNLVRNWHKGGSLEDVVRFMIVLRKELIPDTKLTFEDVIAITGVDFS